MNTFDEFEKKRRRRRLIIIIVSVVAFLIIAAAAYFILFRLFVFQVQAVLIDPRAAIVGSQVRISAQIENKGIRERDYTAELKINDAVIEEKSVHIPAKELATVSFSFTPDAAGIYRVLIGQAEATFEAREGMLPVWYSGDKWTYQASIGANKYQITYEVLGQTLYDNADVYVLRLTGVTPAGPFDRGTGFVDTGSLSIIEEERLGKLNDVSIYQKTVTASEITDGSHWPLAEGNTWTEHITGDISIKNGFSLSVAPTESNRTLTVETIEDITTPLGVYRCFKIVERDEQHAVVKNSWYSDRIKRDARYELFIDGLPYTFDIVACKVAASPPQITPTIEVQKFTEYENTDQGYVLYYQKSWELVTSEEDGSVNIFTTEGTGGINFASARIRVVTVPETTVLDLDIVYEDIVQETAKNDPNFALIDSAKSTAEMPWYNLIWRSKIGDVSTMGRTLLIVRDQQLFIITGWVQENYQKTYWPQLDQLINSIGITAPGS